MISFWKPAGCHHLPRHTHRGLSHQPVSLNSVPSNWYAFIGRLEYLSKDEQLEPAKLLDIVTNLEGRIQHVPRYVWVHVAKVIHSNIKRLNPQTSVRLLHTLAKVQHASPPLVYALCDNLDISILPVPWIPSLLSTLAALTKLHDKVAQAHDSEQRLGVYPMELPSNFIQKLLERSAVVENSSLLNEWHVSDAVWGLSRFGDPQSYRPLVTQLLKDFHEHGRVPEIAGKGLSRIIYAAGHMGIESQYVLQPYLDQISYPSIISSLSLKTLSALIVGLGKMNGLGSGRYMCMHTSSTEICRKGWLSSLSSWDLTSMWWGLATVGVKDTLILDLLTDETVKTRRLSTLNERGLTRVFHSAVKLGVRDGRLLKELMDNILTVAHVGELSICGAAMTLDALDKLNKEDPLMWIEETRTVQNELLKPGTLANSRVKDIDMIVKGLSVLPSPTHARSNGALWRLKMLSGRGELSMLSIRKLTTLVHGLFNLGVADRLVWNGVLEHLDERGPFWDTCSVRELSILIRCLGGLSGRKIKNVMDLNPMLNAMCQSLLGTDAGLSRLSTTGLANVVWGLAMAKVGDEHIWGILVEGVLERQQQGTISLLQLRSIISGFVKLDYIPKNTIESLLENMRRMEDGRNGSHIARLLLTLTKFPLEKKFYAVELVSKLDVASLSNKDLSRAMQAIGKFRLRNSGPVKKTIIEALSTARLLTYTDDQLAWLIYSLGCLQKKGQATTVVIRAFFRRDCPDRLPPWLLSVALYGLALLDHQDRPQTDKILSRLEGSSGFDQLPVMCLVNTFHSLGCLHYQAHEPIMLRLVSALCAKDTWDMDQRDRKIGAVLRTMGKVGVDHAALDKFLSNTVHRESIETVANTVLISSIYAMSKLKYEDSANSDNIFGEVVRWERLQTFSFLHLVEIMYHLHKLKLSDKGVHCIPIFLGYFQWRTSSMALYPEQCGEIIQGIEGLARKDSRFEWLRGLIAHHAWKQHFIEMPTRYLVRLITWIHACESLESKYLSFALSALLDRRSLRDCSAQEILALLSVLSGTTLHAEPIAKIVVDEATSIERVRRYDIDDRKILTAALQKLGVNIPVSFKTCI